MARKYIIEEEGSSWLPFFKWFWRRPAPHGDGGEPPEGTAENPLGRHGAYPARWIAKLSAWLHTRRSR